MYKFCHRTGCRGEDAARDAGTIECLWLYIGNIEERRAVMARCDWEACGPITHKFRIAKTIEAAVFPRPEE